MEENSYNFLRRHKVWPGNNIPEGYRSVWEDRHWLATVKIAKRFNKHTQKTEFAKLLLQSEGDRSADKFVEVHIYGNFGKEAFVGATIPLPEHAKTDKEAHTLNEVRDLLARLNIPCNLI